MLLLPPVFLHHCQERSYTWDTIPPSLRLPGIISEITGIHRYEDIKNTYGGLLLDLAHKIRIQTPNFYNMFPITNSYNLATKYLDYKIAHNLSFYGSPWQGGKKREVMLKTKTGIIIRDGSGLIRKTSIKQREIFHQFYIHSNLNMNAHFHSLKWIKSIQNILKPIQQTFIPIKQTKFRIILMMLVSAKYIMCVKMVFWLKYADWNVKPKCIV